MQNQADDVFTYFVYEFPEPADKPGNTHVKQFHSAVVILHSLHVGDKPFAVFLHEFALPGFQLGCNRYCVPQFAHELGLFAELGLHPVHALLNVHFPGRL